MQRPRPDRWAAFLLSLAVPGAGQLYARHWSCVAWFVPLVALSAGPALLGPLGPTVAAGLTFLAAALLGLASAEHAKRCLEPPAPGRGVPARIDCAPGRGRMVRLLIELEVPRPLAEVWAVVADLPRFACVDPFHSRVVVLGDALRPGVQLALEHQAFGLTFWRFGRLLTWRPGHGYAFSDLSAHGRRHGFPHVFFVSVLPAAADRTCLRIDVRGKWTAPVPLSVGRWWLLYVCQEHARLLRGLFREEDS